MKFPPTVLIGLSLSCICLAQSPREIARTAFKSVVLLEMNDSNGQPLSLGSGFFIAEGVIATNEHVIEGASSGTAKLIGEAQKVQILGTIAVDHHADLALLKVTSSAPLLHLDPETIPVVGDKIYVVGNPLGLEGTFSEGIISGVRAIGSDSILQMTAPISPGSSGGPVMNAAGTVIGVAEATFSNGQNLNLAVPVSYLSKLSAAVSKEVPVIPLGRRGQDRATESIVDGVATRSESGVMASNFKSTRLDFSDSSDPKASYEFRLTNKLPVQASNFRVRIIYYDASKTIVDFEDFVYNQAIPPGLTKAVTASNSAEAGRAFYYYCGRGTNGRELTYDDRNSPDIPKMEPKIELRVVSFGTENSQ